MRDIWSQTTATGDASSSYFPFHGSGGFVNISSDEAATTGVTVQNAGGGGAHNNMQPFAVANVFIKT